MILARILAKASGFAKILADLKVFLTKYQQWITKHYQEKRHAALPYDNHSVQVIFSREKNRKIICGRQLPSEHAPVQMMQLREDPSSLRNTTASLPRG